MRTIPPAVLFLASLGCSDPVTFAELVDAGADAACVVEACDDGNPCTIDACVRGECSHGSVSGAPCDVDGGEGRCSLGACVVVLACEAVDECPARGACVDRACVEGECSYARTYDGAPCVLASVALGSCVEGECVVPCSSVVDCPPRGPCFSRECSAGACSYAIADGLACDVGGEAGTCAAGECVP